MSIATEINRINQDKVKIRNKAVELGIATSIASLDELATAIETIENKGAVQATVEVGDSYTIPKGYHNGTGSVLGIAGEGKYDLQQKTVTPTKAQQSVTPDQGYYGLSGVTVEAIPDNYQDVSTTTAEEQDVLSGKMFIGKDGASKTGSMPNNADVSGTIDGMSENLSVTIPAGYTTGGTVSLSDTIEKALQEI